MSKELMKIIMCFLFAVLFVQCSESQLKVEPQTPAPVSQKTAKPAKPVVKVADKDAKHHHNHITVLDTLAADTLLVDTVAVDSLVADTMQLRILAIGNSFARDAYSYVPFLLHELIPGLQLQFTIMYFPGRPLRDHCTALQSGAREYQRDVYTTSADRWRTEKGHALPAEIDSLLHWDVVLMQQASGASPFYDTYQPYLHELLTAVRANHPEAKYGWLLTPSHPDGYKNMPTVTSDDMWQLICDAVERVTTDEHFDFILPAGTAVQNARHSYLDSLGVFGHLSADGLHLQDGIPCLIEALTITQQLLQELRIPKSISTVTLRPTQQWATERHIPEMHGAVLEPTESDLTFCKRLALRAVANPFSLYVQSEGE